MDLDHIHHKSQPCSSQLHGKRVRQQSPDNFEDDQRTKLLKVEKKVKDPELDISDEAENIDVEAGDDGSVLTVSSQSSPKAQPLRSPKTLLLRVLPNLWHPQASPTCQIIHRVQCDNRQTSGEDHSKHPAVVHYLDTPRLFAKDSRGHALRGKESIADIEEYLEAYPEISLVIYRDYDCRSYHRILRDRFQRVAPDSMDQTLFLSFKAWFYCLSKDGPLASPRSESMQVVAHRLRKAMDITVRNNADKMGPWNEEKNLMKPYDYFYHHRLTVAEHAEASLPEEYRSHVQVLVRYLQDELGSYYQKADELFQSGFVTRIYFPLLFREKDIIVARQDVSEQGFMVDRVDGGHGEGIILHCWNWKFDGTFKKTPHKLTVSWPETLEHKIKISDLKAWPLRLDQCDLRTKLRKRGEAFWSCRKRNLVTYAAPRATNFELQTANPKYMIDMETYEHLHTKAEDGEGAQRGKVHQVETVDAGLNDPPNEEFLLLLPSSILGYGFHDKRWKTLQVEHVSAIPWNEKALDRVVLDDIKKELIKALVTNQLEKNQGADVVENKGNGMILLLHGPPGTGKTLTAESVSELAKKPLYRVTCGDIGTEPESVEKYLEAAFYLGTIWGCVVLLDEADVFLEERTQFDLVRNALVSVFLRVLEYYEGILILTSNRVGTFDEAFKSRMQLAVQYPRLNKKGRYEIWLNFFNALNKAGIEFELDEMIMKVPLLAEHDLNGRQIRNAIKTARQLAKFRRQVFAYEHLNSVINVTNEFEQYLRKTKGHTDDEFAAEQGIR